MRPLEVLLWLANLFTFLVLSVPQIRAAQWARHLVPIGLVIAGVQILVEGARWQMIPAYALSVAFFLVWLLHGNTWAGQLVVQGQTNRLITALGVGLGVLGLTLSLVLPIILPVFRFPRPTGPYKIGTLIYHWVDVDRPGHARNIANITHQAKPGMKFSHQASPAAWLPGFIDAETYPFFMRSLQEQRLGGSHGPDFIFGLQRIIDGIEAYLK